MSKNFDLMSLAFKPSPLKAIYTSIFCNYSAYINMALALNSFSPSGEKAGMRGIKIKLSIPYSFIFKK